MVAPGEFRQTVSKDAYIRAQLLAAGQKGILRYTLPMCLLCVALAVYGINAVYTAITDPHRLSYGVTGCLLLAVALLIVVLWCVVFPQQAKKCAHSEYALYQTLYGEMTVCFTADDMVIKGTLLTRRVEFAKTRLCVETDTQFIVFTDDNTVVLLEKACFADEANTQRFLRDVFARWYKRKG